jgi:hypothetical protein
VAFLKEKPGLASTNQSSPTTTAITAAILLIDANNLNIMVVYCSNDFLFALHSSLLPSSRSTANIL